MSYTYADELKNMKECPFCNINEKFIVEKGKYNDVVLNRGPYANDHLMIIPKKHSSKLIELSTKETNEIMNLIKKYTKILYDFGYYDSGIIIRDGDLSEKTKTGKTIAHTHIHIIPEREIGDVHIWLEEKQNGGVKNRTFHNEESYINLTQKFLERLESIKK